jgi:hypothetical protein
MLELTVNNKLPGDTLFVKPGETIKISARAYGHPAQVLLDRLEIVAHGKVIASVTRAPGSAGVSLTMEKELVATEGLWIALRAYAGPGQAAHSSPVYVSVNGGGFHNRQTLQFYLHLAERYLKELRNDVKKRQDNPELQGWRYRKGLQTRIEATRRVIRQLKKKQGPQ